MFRLMYLGKQLIDIEFFWGGNVKWILATLTGSPFGYGKNVWEQAFVILRKKIQKPAQFVIGVNK